MDQAFGSGNDHAGLSLWLETAGDDLTPRAPLPGDADFDVAIIGGGLTGLWTAYYLQESAPSLKIAILEKEIAGFGASGRNGGWCSALFPASTAGLEKKHGLEAAVRMRQAMIDTVDEVGRAASAAGIDCDYVRGGTIAFARSGVQLASAQAEVSEAERYGVDRLRMLDDTQFSGAARAVGASFDESCARLHPGKLVRGLARVIESRGATIFEGTEVTSWEPRAAGAQLASVHTVQGTVRASNIVIAVEGYGATLAQTHRKILPLYSLMIATEPLDDAVWDDMGIAHGQTFTDHRHLVIYGQRTADNRIAFGGRGARYHWGSSIRPEYDRVSRVFGHLHDTLIDLFPQTKDAGVTHTWGGPLGVPRDWHASATYDAATGIAWAGGYVGDGLSTTNLAGRTLADLICGNDTDLTTLPWVNHHSRNWELEPLRFIGANLGLVAMTIADAEEKTTDKPSMAARAMAPLTGH
ncbi:MAG: NAD(P)/FAD-dependent oxidoreductase [Microbacteriaceae bacterium]